MNKVHVLDCTLRDGGYVNDWDFGDENAKEIVDQLSFTGVEYVEVGFIKLCDYIKDKIQFNRMDQIAALFRPSGQKLSLIVEVGYGYPVTSFPPRSADTVDLVRVIMWKRSLKDGLEYCRRLRELGYEVGVQPTRVEQYSDEEYAELMQNFSTIQPKAIYIVDTFGLLTEEKLLHYAKIADENLGEGIRLGYHAHNNMQQAFANAIAFMNHPWKHEVMLDASVSGMGRGAGNLCLELLLKYLNDHQMGQYNVEPTNDVASRIMQFYPMSPWGYSMPYYLSAINGRNPSYVLYLNKFNLSIKQIAEVFKTMRERNVGITYDTAMCDSVVAEIKDKIN